MAVYYRRFGTNYRSQIHYLTLDGGTIGCPETWLRNCRSALPKIPKDRRSRLHRGECLKSRNFNILSFTSRSSKRPFSFTLHTPPVSTLISSPYYMARCTTRDSPQCIIFFIFLLPPAPQAQIFSSAACFPSLSLRNQVSLPYGCSCNFVHFNFYVSGWQI